MEPLGVELGATKRSPLHRAHVALGAKLVPFGGWEMPISYVEGTIAEHRFCRTDAVMFDVSHLGTVRAQGPAAFDALQRAFTNDLRRIAPGKAQYTHLLSNNGSVLDDIIIWWRPNGVFDVMPNASNTDRVVAALDAFADAETTFVDVTTTRAVVAVQGPQARTRIAGLGSFEAVPRFGVGALRVAGVECIVAGTGYTGELGVEIAVPVASAEAVWNAILACGVKPAGLGARDTLRLEAGLPLHGHELGDGITPWQAKLDWVVRLEKGDFPGRDALVAEQENGVGRYLRGLRFSGRQPGREGAAVFDADGTPVGKVSSGNFSPMLECAIALAFLKPEVALGDQVQVDVRGRLVAATVSATPFYAPGQR